MILFLFDEKGYLPDKLTNMLDINLEKYEFINPKTIFIGPFISKEMNDYMDEYKKKDKKYYIDFVVFIMILVKRLR